MENVSNCAGTTIARYWYDVTGRKIKSVENGVTTYYPFDGYEARVNGSRLENTTYYYANGELVARKDSAGMHYYHGDQLGSTSVITDASGNLEEKTRYYPFGGIRSGGTKTKYLYTGQEYLSSVGLYDYGARQRKQDPPMFIQPDSIIPDPLDPQTLNRYSYVKNNPVKYNDPSGNCPMCGTALIGAALGAVIGGGAQAYYQLSTTGGLNNLNAVGESAVIGGVAGGVAGLTMGLGAGAIAGGGLAAEGTLVAGSGVISGQAALGTSNIMNDRPVTEGMGNPTYMATDAVLSVASWGIIRYGQSRIVNKYSSSIDSRDPNSLTFSKESVKYEEHKAEFGGISQQGYSSSAKTFVGKGSSGSGDIVNGYSMGYTRANGQQVFYNTGTNEFAVSQGNDVCTYFKPKPKFGYYSSDYTSHQT